jgi:short-subunit dehydrogenase
MNYVLILGATSDIANALAHEFAKHGYHLYLAARNPEVLERDVRDFEIRYHVKSRPVQFDIRDYESHTRFYQSLDPRPMGVVCAVGYLGDQEKAQLDLPEMLKIIETNYVGCVSILNIIGDDFEKRKNGFIIGISSVAGDRGRKSNYFYGSAKAGLTAYLSGLRNRLSKNGVHVLTVKPGFVRTKMTEGLELPEFLTANPKEVARNVFHAYNKKRDVVYAKWFWRWIMWTIIHIPEKIFKKMNL